MNSRFIRSLSSSGEKSPSSVHTHRERAKRPPTGETATTTHRTTKASRATQAGNLAAGFKKRYPNGGEKIALPNGQTKTVDEITSGLQTLVTNRANVVSARAAVKAEVESEKSQLPALLALMSAVVAFVRFNFGGDPQALADFGLPPRRTPTPPTAETKAAAVAKREATRAARGTKGPKAKQKIHGNVTTQLVVTPAAPATPESPASPAAPPAAGPTGKQ